jgi:hypothetical protein
MAPHKTIVLAAIGLTTRKGYCAGSDALLEKG